MLLPALDPARVSWLIKFKLREVKLCARGVWIAHSPGRVPITFQPCRLLPPQSQERKGSRWLLRSPRLGAGSSGFAPDVSSPSRSSWILRHSPFPWDAQAAAGSSVGLFVCPCLAGMGLILSLTALEVLGCVKVLGTLQFRLLLLPQCPPHQHSGWAGSGQGTRPGQPQTEPRDVPDQVTPAQVQKKRERRRKGGCEKRFMSYNIRRVILTSWEGAGHHLRVASEEFKPSGFLLFPFPCAHVPSAFTL